MNVLVLGGAGFIGSHLVDRLIHDGHDVSVLDLVASSNPNVARSLVGSHQDGDLVEQSLKGIDAVCHLISTTVPATSNKDMEFDIQSNLVATLRILEAMRRHDVPRIIYLSTGGAIYGEPREYPISESHPLRPICSYGVVKSAVESYLHLFHELHGLSTLVVRPANAYGPGQNIRKPQGVIGHFLANALQNKPIQIWGDGEVRRDYIYVSDLIDFVAQAVSSSRNGVYNVASGEDFSVNEIVAVVQQVIGKDLEQQYIEQPSYDVKRVRLDIEAAKADFDWQPQVSLANGIRLQFASMSSYRESYVIHEREGGELAPTRFMPSRKIPGE